MPTSKIAMSANVSNPVDQGGGTWRVNCTVTDLRGDYFGTDVAVGNRLWAFDQNVAIRNYVRWQITNIVSAVVNNIVVDVVLDPVPGGGDPTPPLGPAIDVIGTICEVVGPESLSIEPSVADQNWSEGLKTRIAEDNYRRMLGGGGGVVFRQETITPTAGGIITLSTTPTQANSVILSLDSMGQINRGAGKDYTSSVNGQVHTFEADLLAAWQGSGDQVMATYI